MKPWSQWKNLCRVLTAASLIQILKCQEILESKKYQPPTDQQRLEEYFWQLERLIPNPPRDWAKSARPCKWLKMIKEKEKSANGSGRQ